MLIRQTTCRLPIKPFDWDRSEGRSVVVGKRLCLIILILSDIASLFLMSMRNEVEHAHQKDDCHHTELHLLHALDSPDLRFAFVSYSIV